MALFSPAPGGGKGSLIHLLVDKRGKPLGIICTSAKGNERVEASHVVGDFTWIGSCNIAQVNTTFFLNNRR